LRKKDGHNLVSNSQVFIYIRVVKVQHGCGPEKEYMIEAKMQTFTSSEKLLMKDSAAFWPLAPTCGKTPATRAFSFFLANFMNYIQI
jgi:hypothetical protein